jgi:hypothetical protein
MTISLPDVPQMPDPGLYELLQAMRRQVLQNAQQIEDATAAFEEANDAGTLPIIVTPPQFDNDLSIATTEFVQRALGNFSEIESYLVNATLTPAEAGRYIIVFNPVTITLPLAATIGRATGYWIHNAAAGGVLVQKQGADILTVGNNNVLSWVIPPSKFLYFVRGFTNEWYATGTAV